MPWRCTARTTFDSSPRVLGFHSGFAMMALPSSSSSNASALFLYVRPMSCETSKERWGSPAPDVSTDRQVRAQAFRRVAPDGPYRLPRVDGVAMGIVLAHAR